MGAETNATLVKLLSESGTIDMNQGLRDITFPSTGMTCSSDHTTLVEADIIINTKCFRRVHPEHLSVYDFTSETVTQCECDRRFTISSEKSSSYSCGMWCIRFDRGYYAGPFGYMGRDSADILVAIRSALMTNMIVIQTMLGCNINRVISSNLIQNCDQFQISTVSVKRFRLIFWYRLYYGKGFQDNNLLSSTSSIFDSTMIGPTPILTRLLV